MKASQVFDAVVTCIKSYWPENRRRDDQKGIALMIWGKPGIGKTAVVKQAIKHVRETEWPEFKSHLVVSHLLDVVDYHGTPMITTEPNIDDRRTIWTPPYFIDRDPNSRGTIFFDELPASSYQVQCALHPFIYGGECGRQTKPDAWSVIAAGNYTEDRCVSHKLEKALESRFDHLDFEMDAAELLTYARKTGWHRNVLAYLGMRPDMIHKFDPEGTEHNFPCPRTWEMVSDLLYLNPPASVRYYMVQGLVGKGAATEFANLEKMITQMPDPKHVLANPATAPVPKDAAVCYALCNALSHNVDASTLANLMEYAKRLPPDLRVKMIEDVATLHADLAQEKSFMAWRIANLKMGA